MSVIKIRLVGEQKDRVFVTIGVDNQIPYIDLKKRIATITKIPVDFQEVRFRGEELPVVECPIRDIKYGEELVVMHSDLPWWEQYKKSADIALRHGNDRMKNAFEAVRIHERLMASRFFMVYCGFYSFQMENHYKVKSWADEGIQLIREATRHHFLQQHLKSGAQDETDFACRFEARPLELGGCRKNTLAYVKLHGQNEETKFNIKYHHFAPSTSSEEGRRPDIKEIYCYKLLELIHVGPQAQFILPKKFTGSKDSLYIVTRWEDNFIPLSDTAEEVVDVLLQILLLGTFLFIDDLHSGNCGYWKNTKEVAIVDFMPMSFATFTNVKRAFLNKDLSVYWNRNHIDALEACSEATRIEVARKCLKKWDLLSKIDDANEQITQEKNLMKQQGFDSHTEELDQYISTIKQNIIQLNEFLTTTG